MYGERIEELIRQNASFGDFPRKLRRGNRASTRNMRFESLRLRVSPPRRLLNGHVAQRLIEVRKRSHGEIEDLGGQPPGPGACLNNQELGGVMERVPQPR